jgi:hypothetical protein
MRWCKTILLLLIAFSLNAQVEYYPGYEGIIITISHGGKLKPDYIDNRDCDNLNCNSDLYTYEIGRGVYKELEDISPYFISSSLHRSKLDPNRDSSTAYNNFFAKYYYEIFHSRILQSIAEQNKDIVLLIDIHGHTHDHGFIELGYNITKNALDSNVNIVPNSSINNLENTDLYTAIFGNNSFGDNLDDYYKVFPSPKYKTLEGSYFNGGYIVETYSDYDNVVCIQVEIPSDIRKVSRKRNLFIKKLANAIRLFYQKIK